MSEIDDLYEQYAKAPAEAAAKAAFAVGFNQGFSQGFEAGKAVGFVTGVNSVAPALSEGTRKGSSECAKALESLKRLGALLDEE